MNDPLLVYDFRADFDGHSFVNERGQQYQCLVEYAPYQKAPKVVTKKDPREGTLEKGQTQALRSPCYHGPLSLQASHMSTLCTSPSPVSSSFSKVMQPQLFH